MSLQKFSVQLFLFKVGTSTNTIHCFRLHSCSSYLKAICSKMADMAYPAKPDLQSRLTLLILTLDCPSHRMLEISHAHFRCGRTIYGGNHSLSTCTTSPTARLHKKINEGNTKDNCRNSTNCNYDDYADAQARVVKGYLRSREEKKTQTLLKWTCRMKAINTADAMEPILV